MILRLFIETSVDWSMNTRREQKLPVLNGVPFGYELLTSTTKFVPLTSSRQYGALIMATMPRLKQQLTPKHVPYNTTLVMSVSFL